MERLTYPEDFEMAWKAYGRVPNQSKVAAASCWDRLKKARQLPDEADILLAIGAYREWLADVSRRQGKPFPQCHMATWLSPRQRKFEEWLPEAKEEAQEGPTGPSVSSWPQDIQARICRSGAITAALWVAWFSPTIFIPGPPAIIKAPSHLYADFIESRFRPVLDRELGPDTQIAVS